MPSFPSCFDHLRRYSNGGDVSRQIGCHHRAPPNYRPPSNRHSLNYFGSHPNVRTFANRHIASKVNSWVDIDVTPELCVMTDRCGNIENAMVTQEGAGVGNGMRKHHDALA